MTRLLGQLAGLLADAVVEGMESLADSAVPGLVLPRLFAGHPIRGDTQADLLYVLGLLLECGVERIAGLELRPVALGILTDLDAEAIEGFSSYRIAETVTRLGGLAAVPENARERVRGAARSPRLLSAVEAGAKRPNFTVVAARCLHASARMNEEDTGADFAALIDRIRRMLKESGTGWINDGASGFRHFDIYTPDMYLFAEPFAGAVGPDWLEGFRRVVGDLDDLALLKGGVVWGRSIGALAQALTAEIAGAAARWNLAEPSRWASRVHAVLDDLETWFSRGLVTAHQRRACDPYRGPSRRLQLTFDLYGKLLLAALALTEVQDAPRKSGCDSFPATDRLVAFDRASQASAWGFRSRRLSFVLPLMSGSDTGYLPSPRSPGLLEQPVMGHPVMVPTLVRDGATLVPGGMPVLVSHAPAKVLVRHEGWSAVGTPMNQPPTVVGSREAEYTVHGRTIEVRERLAIGDAACAVHLSVAYNKARPLTIESDLSRRSLRVDTAGIAEWRSPWGELDCVEQWESAPGTAFDFTWRVTVPVRIATTEPAHQYTAGLYRPMAGRAVITDAGAPSEMTAESLEEFDILHLAWPERWIGTDPQRTAGVISLLKAADVKIAWTQHNLIPHRRSVGGEATYARWAAAADIVIHHTEFGRRAATAKYAYGTGTRHVVIPHGHWGPRDEKFRHISREDVERDEGWLPTGIRLAVVGQPRKEKLLQSVVDAVASCTREDIQLVARLDPSVRIPADHRIIAEYGHLSSDRYQRRLRAFDAVVFPFAPQGMLATGAAFDCIGAGIAAITSDWPFLDEVFAGSGIRCGSTTETMTACFDSLTREHLDTSRRAVIALRPAYEWDEIARQTLEVFEDAVP